jgi:hypothetical protein
MAARSLPAAQAPPLQGDQLKPSPDVCADPKNTLRQEVADEVPSARRSPGLTPPAVPAIRIGSIRFCRAYPFRGESGLGLQRLTVAPDHTSPRSSPWLKKPGEIHGGGLKCICSFVGFTHLVWGSYPSTLTAWRSHSGRMHAQGVPFSHRVSR